MLRFLAILCLGLLLTEVTSAQESATIDLGPIEEVKALYSAPNNCAEVCYSPTPSTLKGTIEHYLGDSLKRDGHSKTTVNEFESDGRVRVTIEG
jgi:hypothetical protein